MSIYFCFFIIKLSQYTLETHITHLFSADMSLSQISSKFNAKSNIKGCVLNRTKLQKLAMTKGQLYSKQDLQHVNLKLQSFIQHVIETATQNPGFNANNGISRNDILYSLQSQT
jgi:hypothetical protein